MIKSILEKAGLNKGNERTVKAKKNILALFLIHPFNLLLTLLLVPVTLKSINSTEYGIWLTISSITTWFIALDFGLGNGLRNKLAEAFAKKDFELAKVYVSTTYFYIAIISAAFFVIFFASFYFIPWIKILNSPAHLEKEVNLLVLITFSLFVLNFVLKLISFVIIADQKPALNGFFTLLVNFFTVAFVYILSLTKFSSLLYVGILYSIAPGLVFIGASLFLFKKNYKRIRPSIKYIKPAYSKELVNLGIQFFVIQISTLITMAAGNLIITQIFSPADVTVYNIAHRYFYTLFLIFMVILNPFWSAITDAFVKGENDWIKNSIKRLLQIWIIFSIAAIIMVVAANFVYKIWIGGEIKIPFLLNIFMALFIIILMWNNIFISVINGLGKIRLQLYSSIITGLFNIPLAIYLSKNFDLGISGVILATCIALLVQSIWVPVQYSKIINGKATGIWNK